MVLVWSLYPHSGTEGAQLHHILLRTHTRFFFLFFCEDGLCGFFCLFVCFVYF